MRGKGEVRWESGEGWESLAIIIICTLFKLAFISCVFRNPNTLDSIPMKHELTSTFTSKLVTTLDVGVFNLYTYFVHSGENSMFTQFIIHSFGIWLLSMGKNRLNSNSILTFAYSHKLHTHTYAPKCKHFYIHALVKKRLSRQTTVNRLTIDW